MELALVSQRSDKRLLLHSPRIVTLPARDGNPARKVAAIAPFAAGWVVVPLVDEPVVFINSVNITEIHVLQVDDCLEIQNVGSYLVEHTAVDPVQTDTLLGLARRECTVEVRLDGELVHHVQADRELLIGSGANCDLLLDEEEIDAEHILLVHHQGFWNLLDLSGRGVARLGSKPVRHLLLLPGDSAWLSDSLEVTIHYENKDLLDRSGLHSALPSQQTAAKESDPAPSEWADPAPDPKQSSAEEQSAESLAAAIHERAVRLCQWVQLKLAGTKGASGEPISLGIGWLPVRANNPVAELDRYEEMLSPNPRNFRILHQLSRYLTELGHTDLARIILKEIVQYFPRESAPLRELALIYYEQSDDETRPLRDRLADLRRGQKYVAKALVLCPEDVRFVDLLRKIDATLYILENEDR